MKTNTKNTLKKLGLGVSAFACFMTMGANVSADTSGSTTVTYDNRTYTEGGSSSGGATWGVYVPTKITLNDTTAGVENEITIVNVADGTSESLESVFSELTVSATVKSANKYVLKGTGSNTANYTLKADGNASIFEATDSEQAITKKLGVGSDSQVTSIALTSKLTSTGVAQDSYTDTLTFSFTQDKATDKA